ncbi:hypothetical protein DERF_007937, partial [Dermatophagoides farinae]
MALITEFCNSYDDYKSCLEYMSDHQITTVEDFKNHLVLNAYSFLRLFKSISLSKLESDLEVFQIEYEKKMFMISTQDGNQIVYNCDHPCCSVLNNKLNEVLNELKIIKSKNEELESWIKQELKKVDNPMVIQQARNAGDFLLEEKWLVKYEFLQNAANDCGKNDLANLMDSVFGKKFLQKYKSYKDLPSDLRNAIDTLIERYVRAKIQTIGGEYGKILSHAKQRLNKRFDNWARYNVKKK